jgi:hypothetical protein
MSRAGARGEREIVSRVLRGVVLALLVVMLGAAGAVAQDDAGPDGGAGAADVRFDEVTGAPYRLARPEEPLRRGAWPVAPEIVVAAGAITALGAAALLVRRLRRSRR